ncbi:MAG: hypothetical protein FWF99_01845, partial [Desulfovibrionaceae bacterium]|nr:hypothetical protein [Desulfovibrionaceae bacterium]
MRVSRICWFTLLCLASYWPESSWAGDLRIYNFNMSGGYALRHPVTQEVFLPWAERVRQRTGGRVQIAYFPPNALGPELEHFEMVRKGRVDIGHNYFARNPGRFLVSGVADLPEPGVSPPEASVALWRMVKDIPEMRHEFAEVKILSFHVSAPAQFCWGSSEKIARAGQARGKKILVADGDAARVARHLGASPFIIPRSDFGFSLARNMADGCVLPVDGLRALNMSGQIKGLTLSGHSYNGWWMAMSLDAWNSLPKDLQRILEEESGEKLAYLIGQGLAAGERAELDSLAAEGLALYEPEEADRDEWREQALVSLKEEWFRRMRERRLPAQRIFDESR